jgi:bifunctional non-homologous end joining protein LigD
MASAKKTAKPKPAKTAKPRAIKSAKKSPRGKPAQSPSSAIDEQLARYRSMRDFHITTEPSGASKPTKKDSPTQYPFVIQKHAASHLHYDFRLGWNGVLKSWAVAKGPSYAVADKRLAVQVEDHPMEYGGFEGIIPKGQYGGGTVMLWDQGTWEPQPAYPDVDAGLRDGSLKFILHGTKLQGKWALIRMGGKHAGSASKPNWLLIKEHDPFERPPSSPPVTESEPNSVVTGRSLEQIAASQDHVWNSKETNSGSKPWYTQPSKSVPGSPPPDSRLPPAPKAKANNQQPTTSNLPPATFTHLPRQVPHSSRSDEWDVRSPFAFTPNLTHLPPESQPTFIPPQLAQQAETPPSNSGWFHELKLDGYRIQVRKDGSRTQLLTRTGLDWTHRMSALAAEVARLPAESCTLDGEVVVLAPDGTTSFADLQAAFQNDANHPSPKHHLTYFAFDLLHLNGHNTRDLPLRERKALLAQLLASADPQTLPLSDHLESNGPAIFHKACEMRAEGIVSKLASAKYISGRSSAWLKSKCLHEQEFVIAGFTLPSAGHTGMRGVGALLLGCYDRTHTPARLIYAGRVGTGFTQKTHKLLRDQLDPLTQRKSPFDLAAKPLAPSELRAAHWVRPTLVAQVRFATWTADTLVRQAAFLGLREDKPALEVTRESSAPTPKSSKPSSSQTTTKAHVPHSSRSHRDEWDVRSQPATVTASHPTATPKAALRTPRNQPTTSNQQPATPNIRLTHPAKILDPQSSLTKQALADYYFAVAPLMLPHIAHRPLSLVRCPEGSAKPCFFQKHVNATLPPGIGSIPVPDKKAGVPEPYITLDNDATNPTTLASLAQLGVLEIHPWGSRNDSLEHPDRLIFDLDPDESLPWSAVTAAALDVRARLKKLGLTSFLKTTGGKGLHIVLPIDPTPKTTWPAAKDFAHRFVLAMEKSSPSRYLTKMTKSARTGRIFLDYLRNERGATAVAPYSPRARAGAPVSIPLAWAEISASAAFATHRPTFPVANFPDWSPRLKRDPWRTLPTTHQPLPTP